MSFLTEINEMLGIDHISTDMCITFMIGKGAVVQGYKKILSISDSELIVAGKNKRIIKITGSNLEIFSLACSEIVLHGKIERIEECHD